MLKTPIFIVGCPRSGTTLIRQILDSHSKLAIVPESSFLIRMSKFLPLYRDIEKTKNLLALVSDILAIERVKQWFPKTLKPEDVIQKINSDNCSISFASILDAIYSLYMDEKNKIIWGDKTPKNLFFIPLILEMFPNAKFIIMIRDGRDIALSLKEVDFGKIDLITSAFEWKNYLNFTYFLERNCPQFLTNIKKVYYEEFLSSPKLILKDIFYFLNVKYEDDILDKYLTHEDDVTHSKSDHYGKQINESNSYKWKINMSKAEIEVFENIAGECLKRENYELITSQEKQKIKIKYLIIYKINQIKRFLNPVYRANYINFLTIILKRSFYFWS